MNETELKTRLIEWGFMEAEVIGLFELVNMSSTLAGDLLAMTKKQFLKWYQKYDEGY
jgi:hypothetical protein